MPLPFKQQFQDSQAYSQSNLPTQQSYPLQLACIKPTTLSIELNQKALDIIAECDLPVGFVTFTGKYRVGKSTLINRILGINGKNGFKTSSNTKQCTKGIWMWSKPYYSAEYQCYLFFLDTEGTQALQKQTEIDIKLFTLNCLLSSYLIFNSVGNIDERSIQQLNLVSSLSKNILISSDSSINQNNQQLHLHMPKFLWLLRDFTLQLRDSQNLPQSASQYLQQCLSSKSLLSSTQQTTKIKNQIVKLFRNRDCFTLVRPARDQYQLQRMGDMPDHLLRREFVEGVGKLKHLIFKNAQPKMYQNQPLYGSAVVSMLESYVQTMNNGGIPKIKTAWQQIGQDEGTFAYNHALQHYNQLYNINFTSDQPFPPLTLHQILSQLRQSTLLQFNKSISQPNQSYHQKLKQYLKSKQKSILQVNKRLSDVRNMQLLKQLSMPFMRKIEQGVYKSKRKEVAKDLEQVVKEYNAKAIGENKGDILAEFLTTINPIIFAISQNQQSNKQNSNPKISALAMEQFNMREKVLNQQLKNIKKQSQLKELNFKKRQKQLKDANQQLKKNKSNGCCQIM